MTVDDSNYQIISTKKTTINFVANCVSFIVQLAISFFMTPILINSLGKEMYSFYPIANNIVSYMTIVTTALNTMASRFITFSLAKNKMDDAKKYYSSIITSNFLLTGILLIPSILFVTFIDSILNIPLNGVAAVQILFSLVFSSALVNVVSNIFGIATFAKNRLDLRSLREIIASVAKLLLYVIFFVFLRSSIVFIGITVLIVAVINFTIQFIYTKALMPELPISIRYSDFQYTKELFASSFWNIVSALGGLLICGFSLVLANIYFGESASGSYSIVQTVPALLNTLISMLCGVFFPVITYKYALGDKHELVKEIKKDQAIIASISCAVVVVFSVFSESFFSLWVPSEDSKQLFVLSIAVISQYFFTGCFYNLYHLSVAMNKVKVPALFQLGFGALNVLLSFVGWKIFGFGLISLPIISSSLNAIWIGVIYPVYLSKKLGISMTTFYITFLKTICVSALLFIVMFFAKHYIPINSWLTFILFGGLFGLLALIALFLSNLGIKNIVCLLREKLKH